jgi:hypothetical protein
MHPAAIVQDEPEGIAFEPAEVRDDHNEHVLDALIMERSGEVVMIDDIMSVFRPENDGDHVPTEEFGALLRAFLAPAFPFGLDLTHPHRDLRRVQVSDLDRVETGFANGGHLSLLEKWRVAAE